MAARPYKKLSKSKSPTFRSKIRKSSLEEVEKEVARFVIDEVGFSRNLIT